MTIQDQFFDLLMGVTIPKLIAAQNALDDAIRSGATPSQERDNWLRLKNLRASINAVEDRAALIAQWPSDFPPLPDWFVNPQNQPPLGEAVVLDCTPKPVPIDPGGEDGEAS